MKISRRHSFNDGKTFFDGHSGVVAESNNAGMAHIAKLHIINNCESLHAGGPGIKQKLNGPTRAKTSSATPTPSTAATTSSNEGSVGSTGVEGAVTVASGSDEDGDGDGDPDSDRRKKICPSKSLSPALVQRAIPNRILRMPELKVRIGLSRSTIYEAISKGEFPPSISLGARAVGWLESDVDAWVQSRVSASKAL